MKVAAYQAPLLAISSTEILDLIREQVNRCEMAGAEILCCPEGALGGLADYAARPADIAIGVEGGQLKTLLAPLESDTVATILGFTELGRDGLLYNSAAVFYSGSVAGIYRKRHPAINKSVYTAGAETPVFKIGGLTFGILICRDSNYPELARSMAARGATALFVPTNNGLPPTKAGPEIVGQTRAVDVARAKENGAFVIRADVAGRAGNHVSYGSSGIVGPGGLTLRSARPFEPDLLVAEIEPAPRRPPHSGNS